MRRVLAFFAYQEACWHRLAAESLNSDPRTADGMRAYAMKQAALQCRLILGCEKAWKDVPADLQTGAAVGSTYCVERH